MDMMIVGGDLLFFDIIIITNMEGMHAIMMKLIIFQKRGITR